MTALIQSQALTMVIMLYCGMTIAIIYDVFTLFIEKFTAKAGPMAVILRLSCYVIIAFAIGEFTMFCQNGKLTFYEMVFLAIGLLLWRKIIYGKISSR